MDSAVVGLQPVDLYSELCRLIYNDLLTDRPMRRCPGCGVAYKPTNPRQRWCTGSTGTCGQNQRKARSRAARK